jgi:hypothetical protein
MAEIRQLIMENQLNVLILNGFEWVTLTARQKHDLSIELIRLQEELAVTVIIFTQEVRKEMKPGILGRGPIGRLQCMAGTVVRIEGDGENLFDNRDKGWETWVQKANEILGFAKPAEPVQLEVADNPPTDFTPSSEIVILNGVAPESVILNGAQQSEVADAPWRGSHGVSATTPQLVTAPSLVMNPSIVAQSEFH